MQVRFDAQTDAFQLHDAAQLVAVANGGGRLEWARAERAFFRGRERWFVDLTFVAGSQPAEGVPPRAVVLLVERIPAANGSGPVYVFPECFRAAGEDGVAGLAQDIESAAAALLEGKDWPEAGFLLGPDGPESRAVVPGLAPYAQVLPALTRTRGLLPALKDDGRVLHLGGDDAWTLGVLNGAERVALSPSLLGRVTLSAFAREGSVRLQSGDVRSLDLRRGFDLVVATLADPCWAQAQDLLYTAVRHLNNDGAFVLTVPAPARRLTRVDETPDGQWNPEQLEAVLRERFDDVEFVSQGAGLDAAPRPGTDASAATVTAVARRPRRPRAACTVSVVIPVFNKIDYTTACVRALAAHTPFASDGAITWEAIVVDNGSSDATPATLQELAAEFPWLRTWRNEKNLGFARACNQGARLARGRIVVFLNNDTEVHPGWLPPLVDEMDAHPETGIAGARLLYADGTIQHAGVAIGRDKIPYHIHCRAKADDPRVMERRRFPIVTGACLVVRREEFFARGMFDEVFVNGHEDIDLCLRFGKAGRHVVYRPESVVTHFEMVSDGRLNHREQNLLRTFGRWRNELIQDDFSHATAVAGRGAPERPLRFALKIGVPTRAHGNWGDIFFAEGFAKALHRAGHSCVVQYLNEWGTDDLDVDVVLHVSGLSEYHPKPWNVNLMWMINHPSRPSGRELARYDALLVASTRHARTLRGQAAFDGRIPVFPFLQATDPEHFVPRPEVKPFFDVVFIGNNKGEGRLEMRQIVADLLPTTHRLGVWGACWDGLLPQGVWQGTFVPHEKLPEIYNLGRVVLNDHQPEMKAHGFVNNRTFDATACGAIVVSDHVDGLAEQLDVRVATDARSLKKIVDRALADYPTERERAARLRERVLAEHTFDHRVKELLAHLDQLGPAFERAHAARASARRVIVEQHPLVSIMVATYDRRAFLPATLDTMKAQTYPNWELLLVNDGGPSVADIVAAKDDPRIKLVELPENRGKGHCINKAFSLSRGPLLAYQDDDDIWHPDHLERVMLPVTSIPGIDFAYSAAVDVTYDETEDGAWREVRRELIYDRQVVSKDLLFGNSIQGIVVVHRRELFERVGGMDERLKVLIDWDLWRRICALTYPYHVARATADRTLRGFTRTSGTGHLTSLHKTDPARYAYHRLRVQRKPLPVGTENDLVVHAAKVARKGRQEFLAALAGRCEQNGDLPRAIHWYDRALAVEPVSLGIWRSLGMIHLKRQHPDQAFPFFALAADHHAANLQDFLYATLCCLAQGRGDEALRVLDVAEKRIPELVTGSRELVEEYRAKARAVCAKPALAGA